MTRAGAPCHVTVSLTPPDPGQDAAHGFRDGDLWIVRNGGTTTPQLWVLIGQETGLWVEFEAAVYTP